MIILIIILIILILIPYRWKSLRVLVYDKGVCDSRDMQT